MESSRKRRTGLIKGKLVKCLYRPAAATHLPSTTTSPTNYYSSSKDDTPPPTVYHLQLHHHHQQPKEKLVPFNPNNISIPLSSTFIVNQDQAAPPQKPKVSYYVPPRTNYNYAEMVDKTYVDESIDMKAAHYISYVEERFKSVDQLSC